MFDGYLRERAAGRDSRSSPSTPRGTTTSTSTGSPASRRRALVPGQPVHPPARGGTGRPARRGDGRRPGQPQEPAVPALGARRRRRGVPGLGRYVQAARDARARRGGRVVERQHPGGARGHRAWTPAWSPGGRGDRPRGAPARASRRPTPSWPAPSCSAWRPTGPRSSRTRWPGWRPAGPGGFGFVVGVDRVGQADALRGHGADVVVTDLAELLEPPGDQRATPSPSSRGACARPRSTSDSLAQSESVFALSNGHIGLRGNLDEGEPHGLPGTYLNSLLRDPPAALRRGRLRLPRVRADARSTSPTARSMRLLVDDEPFDVRYGELLAHERVLDLRAGTLRRAARLALPGRAEVQVTLHPARVVHPARRGRHPSTSWSRSTVHPGDGAVRAGGQRGRCRPRPATPAWRRCSSQPLERGSTRRRRRRAAGAPDQGQRAAGWPPAWTTSSTGPSAGRVRRTPHDWARTTVVCGLRPGQRLRIVKFVAYGWSAGARVPALRDQVDGGAGRGPATPAGTGCWRAARLPGRLLGRRRRRARGRRRSSSRRCGSGSSTCCRPAPGPSAAPIAGQGPDRARLRRARLLGHRELRAAGADLHRAARPRDALRWRHSTLDLARTARLELDLAGATLPVADHPRRGVLGVLAGRHRRVARQRRHRGRPSPGTVVATGDARVRPCGLPAWTCWPRPRGSGGRWATTTATAGSTSTVSPGRTSTAPWSATTSSPT